MFVKIKAKKIVIKNQFNLEWHENLSLNSSLLPNSLRCILICESVNCESLKYDQVKNDCFLLIKSTAIYKYNLIGNMTITYLSNFFNCLLRIKEN